MTESRYITIKRALVAHIESGEWTPGTSVPSENGLADEYGVSRMTARRALTELVEAGVLTRSQGAGTFVAEQLPTGSLLTIRSIDTEVSERGHRHSAEVLQLQRLSADSRVAAQLQVSEGDDVYFSRVLHFETDARELRRPIQLEERYVNADIAADYLKQDFTAQTPSAYLQRIAPLMEADHWVEAALPSAEIADWLQMDRHQAVLKLTRKTYSYRAHGKRNEQNVVTFATLYYPGDRYRLGGHFGSSNTGELL